MDQSNLLKVCVGRRLEEAEDIVSLELWPIGEAPLPSFEAGSHVDVHIATGLVRQYSLCNDPRETQRYVLGVQREAGSRGGSRAIYDDFVEGHTVWISRPRNNFRLAEAARHSILLAGGIGITPILAMAWRLHALDASFELHYCARSLTRAAFRDQLKYVPFADRIFLHLDDGPDEQRLHVEQTLASPDAGTHLYVCGPSGFMTYATEGARRHGWAEECLHGEYFAAEIDTEGEAFTVHTARTGLDLTVGTDQTIAQVLLEHGVDVTLSCEQGVCGACLTRVIEGVPDHRDMFLTEEEKAANDHITICCSRSKSRVLVLDV